MNSGFLASTYPIEHSMWSLVRPALGPAGFTLWYNFRKNNKVTIQTKFSQRLLPDLFTFLSSIRGFRDTSEALENQVNANVGEVCSVICLFYGALNYLGIFWIQAYATKCAEKANFWCTWRARKVLSTYKKSRSTGWILLWQQSKICS